jgi:hypothetical protein
MSTVSEVVASKLLQREQNKMQKCFRCKEAGFPNKLIGFEKILLGLRNMETAQIAIIGEQRM